MVDQKIYVTQANNSTGGIIILDKGHEVGNIQIGSSSYGIEVYPNNYYLYVTSKEQRNGTFYVYVVSPPSSPSEFRKEIPLADSPLNIAFNSFNNKMYVTHPTGNSMVSVINPSTYQVETTISLPNQAGANSIAFNPSNGEIYITNQGSNTVTVIDTNNQVKKDIPVGSTPIDVAFNPSNGNMYVTNQGSNTVSVIDSTKYEVIYTYR